MAVIVAYASIKLTPLIISPLEAPTGVVAIGLILLPINIIIFIMVAGFLGFGSWYLLWYFLEKYNLCNEQKIESNKKTNKLTFSDVALGTFTGIVGLTVILVGFVMFSIIDMDIKVEKKYNKTFEVLHQTYDFNDSRIFFYKNELDTQSKYFIESDSAYPIFEADVKRQIALECISLFQKEHFNKCLSNKGSNTVRNINASCMYDSVGVGLTNYNPSSYAYKQMREFKKNARNKYANNEKSIKKAKTNETFIKNKNDIYRYYENEYSISQVLKKVIPNRCSRLLSVDSIFDKYISLYIENKEVNMKEYLLDTRRKIKYKYQRKYSEHLLWLKTLYKEHPEYTRMIKTLPLSESLSGWERRWKKIQGWRSM